MKWRYKLPSEQLVPVKYCDGKICYDKRGAVTASNKRMEDDHMKLRIYHCPWCDQWHLTKQL